MPDEHNKEVLRRIEALEAEMKLLRRIVERKQSAPKGVAKSGRQAVPLLSPREASERILGHDVYSREDRLIHNMSREVTKACRLWRDPKIDREERDYFGLPHEVNASRRIFILEPDVIRWARRLGKLRYREVDSR